MTLWQNSTPQKQSTLTRQQTSSFHRPKQAYMQMQKYQYFYAVGDYGVGFL